MELRDGMFAVKLCELEHQYGLLRSRLELCQGADHEKIRHLLADVLDDYRENALLLEQSAEGCRSPAVAELAGVQRDYSKRMEELLRDRLPRLMHGEEDPQEERAEAAAPRDHSGPGGGKRRPPAKFLFDNIFQNATKCDRINSTQDWILFPFAGTEEVCVL